MYYYILLLNHNFFKTYPLIIILIGLELKELDKKHR